MLKEIKEIKVQLELLVTKEQMEHKVLLVNKELLVNREQLEHKEP